MILEDEKSSYADGLAEFMLLKWPHFPKRTIRCNPYQDTNAILHRTWKKQS